jgi:type I restriction enzyme S subunit
MKYLSSYKQTLNSEGLAVSKLFPRGTLVMTIAANIGDVAILGIDAAFPDSLVGLSPKDDVCPQWLFYALRHNKRDFVSLAPTNAQANLNVEKLEPLKFLVPPLPEQRRIAEILEVWDRSLERLDRQIERKRQLFMSLREALVRGTRRLGGHHQPRNKRALGRFLRPIKRAVPKPGDPYLAISLRSHGKGTFRRLVDRPEEVDMDTLFRVGGRDLIVNITFAWEGAIALAKTRDEGCLVSHRFPTFEIDEATVDRDFLGYAVNDKLFFYYLGIASPGGAGRNRVLNQQDFLDIEIPFPPICEQHAIANVLVDAERELVALESERIALEKQRDALASELLTGRIRVREAVPLFEAAG